MRVFDPTLRGQVLRYAMLVLGWPTGAAEDAADIAVEIAGSNRPVFGRGLGQVVSEACHVDGEGWDALRPEPR